MKKFLILIAILAGLAFTGVAHATSDSQTLSAIITQTNADTASVALVFPNSQQTILIKDITIWYDNAANTNPLFIGINDATAAFTRRLWLGQAMATSGIATIQYLNINQRIDPTVAQAGVRAFLSAASSDSIMAIVNYEIVPK